MSIIECVRLALRSVSVNKLRSFLTMLGIIIGISSVITITTIGTSLQKTIDVSMSKLGNTNLIYSYLTPKTTDSGTDETGMETTYPEMTSDDLITYDMVKAFRTQFSGRVDAVLATSEVGSATCTGNGNTQTVNVTGSTAGYLKTSNLTLLAGRDISDADVTGMRPTAVVSDLFVKYVFGTDTDPLGKKITLSISGGTAIDVYIVGVYHYDSKVFGTIGSTTAESKTVTPLIVPVSYANDIVGGSEGFSAIQVLATQGQDPTVLASDISSYFNSNYYNSASDKWSVESQDMASALSQVNNVLSIITVAISIIAGISLVVGGVGVMNIMLVSVVERTREIGIRKALGAKNSGIRLQFLMEAVVICVIGGLIGIALGILNGYLLAGLGGTLLSAYKPELASYLTVTVQPSLTAVIVSVIFSMATGILFGYYPANRAAKMSPIDALRYE